MSDDFQKATIEELKTRFTALEERNDNLNDLLELDQIEIKELERLVKEMGDALQSSQIWLVTLKAYHSSSWSDMTHQIWNTNYDTTDELLSRKNVKKIMKTGPQELKFTF